MKNPIWQVFRYELRRNVRRKGYLFGTFGVPVVAILILLIVQAIASASAPPSITNPLDAPLDSDIPAEDMGLEGIKKGGYVDYSGLFGDPGDLAEQLTLYPDEEAATAALELGDIDGYFVIPTDYMTTGDVTLVLPQLSVTQIDSTLIRRLILNTLAGDVQDENLFYRLLDPANVQSENLSRAVPTGMMQGFDANYILVYVFTIALMMGLFLTNGYLMQGLIEEKENRVVEILLSSLRPAQLLIGKILAFGILGLLQMVVWIGFFLLLLRNAEVLPVISVLASMYVPVNILPLVFVYFLLAYLFFAAGYGIVGAISGSAREGPQYAVIFTLPAIIPLWLMSVFVTAPDSNLPVVLSVFPITSPIAMVQRLLLTSVPAWQIALSLVVMVLTIVGMMWLAGRLFRVQTLLAGQTPKLRDLTRIMRG